jgi:hypothetical protein
MVATVSPLRNADRTAVSTHTYGKSIAITITNHTNETLVLVGTTKPHGNWITAPTPYVSPRSYQVVHALTPDPDRFDVALTYALSGSRHVTLRAGSNGSSVNIDRGPSPEERGDLRIGAVITGSSDNMRAAFDVGLPLATPNAIRLPPQRRELAIANS